MASQNDVRQVSEQNRVASKRSFNAADFGHIAEYIIEIHSQRKRKRKETDLYWKEIDRQIAMEPDRQFKKLPSGKIDTDKMWMSEMELPLQAQALEVLTADARRMMFADAGASFRAHGEMTDDYLDGVDFQSFILGDKAEVPSQIDQDNLDKLIEGFLAHQHRQYDFRGHCDLINAESFKYGMGVGRGRMQTKSVYIDTSMGTRVETQKIPVLAPVSIKNLYLDDPMPSMHSAQVLGPAHIAEDHIKLENLAIAANKGSTDPEDEDGGWMPAGLKKVKPNENGYVQVLEMEGDIVVPRKTMASFVIPGAIATVAVGAADGGKATRGLIRFRFRKAPWSSYLLFPYHREHVDNPYPASPLMKGRPVQIMAVDALNRLMDSAALKNAPPVGYDRDDQEFAKSGGPRIHPFAKWGTQSDVQIHEEIGGDTSSLSSVLSLAINLYAELTGILPARLGAQTVSHTTAFAKDAELQRGAVRTVDYVRQSQKASLPRWLEMSYAMGRDSMGSRETLAFYIESYGGFVEIGKQALPERAVFEWFGAGGPAEEQAKKQAKIQSAAMALQIDNVNMQTGGSREINVPNMIREILREGGWTDLDVITGGGDGGQPSEDPGQVIAALGEIGAE